jgi:hypothetical protein
VYVCVRVLSPSIAEQKEQKKRKLQEEKQAFGTYAGDLGTTLTYRVKKPGAYGGYKIVTEVRVSLLVDGPRREPLCCGSVSSVSDV